MKRLLLMGCCVCGLVAHVQAQLRTNEGIEYLQCQAPDVSGDFCDLANTYFLADSIANFDLNKGEGMLNWKRYRMSPRQAFNLNGYWPVRMQMLDFPSTQYDNDQSAHDVPHDEGVPPVHAALQCGAVSRLRHFCYARRRERAQGDEAH